MGKYLKEFELTSQYEEYINSAVALLPNVSHVKETPKVFYNPIVSNNDIELISLCDIAYWDGSAVKTVSKDNWSTSLGTPIGVVVIPSGILPDGKARMVGLKPGNKSIMYGSRWGDNSIDTSLTNYTKIPLTNNDGSTSISTSTWGYLPGDKLNDTGVASYVDSGAKYASSAERLFPSPYLYNGKELKFNPEYSKAIEGNNALSDFNGLSNTETLVGLGTGYTGYEAAGDAWEYSDGASNTQWYLPAIGELGFLWARVNEINSALTSVGGVAIEDPNLYYMLSSTEYNSKNYWNIHISEGYLSYYNKNSGGLLRVFGHV